MFSLFFRSHKTLSFILCENNEKMKNIFKTKPPVPERVEPVKYGSDSASSDAGTEDLTWSSEASRVSTHSATESVGVYHKDSTVFLLSQPSSVSSLQEDDDAFGPTPVIGILSQPRIASDTEETEFVIAASYSKWAEAAGARVMPIPWDATVQMVQAIFPKINGVLFPGGNSILPVAAKEIWRLANEANDRGDFFPIWGTCLGYEYLLMLASGKKEFILEGGYDSHNVSWPVTLTPPASDIYANRIIREIVTNQPVTMNNHEFGLKPETFERCPGLRDMFQITSVNTDRKGTPFVSTIESRDPHRYPYYGVQYHPEKNAYEYATFPGTNVPFEQINHSADAVYFSFHLASFFVELARKNKKLSGVLPEPIVEGGDGSVDEDEFPLIHKYEIRSGFKFQQYYIIPAVGCRNIDGATDAPFTGKDFSWRLDTYLEDHVGIYKEGYTDE